MGEGERRQREKGKRRRATTGARIRPWLLVYGVLSLGNGGKCRENIFYGPGESRKFRNSGRGSRRRIF